MKLCNVCGKELKRPHPGCNAKAERAKRAAKVAGAVRAVEAQEAEVAMHGEVKRRVLDARDRAMLPGDPFSRDIASMGQPARDAILHRIAKVKE